MLLAYVEHAFLIEKQTEEHSHSPRGLLISWTFKEMYNLRSLSEILMTMPLDDGLSTMAGPPFEMPYTLTLPPRPAIPEAEPAGSPMCLLQRLVGAEPLSPGVPALPKLKLQRVEWRG